MAVVSATEANIKKAAALLRAGQLVAFPTETVYGLGADATNGRAVAAVYETKGRPSFNPLIVHVSNTAAAEKFANLCERAHLLAKTFWPGPLTLVLPRRTDCAISELVTAGLETLAIRVPAHPVAQRLLAEVDRPLAAPSANRSGHVSPTRAEHVEVDLGNKVAMIIDGGPCARGLESTVVSLATSAPQLLRSGAVVADEIQKVLGVTLIRNCEEDQNPSSPGQLSSHYAPAAKLRLHANTQYPGEAFLAFGPNAPASIAPAINLSPRGDLVEAATNLFAALRTLDASGATTIAVMTIPDEGLGEAINDRLRRAAAPRTS